MYRSLPAGGRANLTVRRHAVACSGSRISERWGSLVWTRGRDLSWVVKYAIQKETMAAGTAMYSRMPKEKWRFLAASLKLGSMSQNRSKALAKIIHWQTLTRRFLLRLMSRESRREKGMTQWKMKSRVMMMPQWPRMRSRYQLISSGRLPDQMMRNCPKAR